MLYVTAARKYRRTAGAEQDEQRIGYMRSNGFSVTFKDYLNVKNSTPTPQLDRAPSRGNKDMSVGSLLL